MAEELRLADGFEKPGTAAILPSDMIGIPAFCPVATGAPALAALKLLLPMECRGDCRRRPAPCDVESASRFAGWAALQPLSRSGLGVTLLIAEVQPCDPVLLIGPVAIPPIAPDTAREVARSS